MAAGTSPAARGVVCERPSRETIFQKSNRFSFWAALDLTAPGQGGTILNWRICRVCRRAQNLFSLGSCHEDSLLFCAGDWCVGGCEQRFRRDASVLGNI